MKKQYTFFLLLIIATSLQAFAQQPASKPGLSASTLQYLWKVQHSTVEEPLRGYVYAKDKDDQQLIAAFIRVPENFDAAALNELGVKVNSRIQNIWTVHIPPEHFAEFTTVPGINFIDLDRPACMYLDSARKVTGVDSLQKGINLPQGFSGKNTVVGIIDAGFDYTHPVLYDTTYQHYRVRRVWEEKNNTGIPPSGFTYGSEYADSAAIIGHAYDFDYETHGTHVAGIAGGSGYGSSTTSNHKFRGMAYESDLVLIGIHPDQDQWLSTGMSDILDGIRYVFEYGASVDKPAVANLSWGGPLGPRDGNSLFSQACDNLTGEGKIFVLSAGNNGGINIHLQKTFTATDTIVHTFHNFSEYLDEKINWADVWGEPGKSFCMQFRLYHNGAAIDSSVFICLDNTTQPIKLVGSNGDTCSILLTTVSAEFNNKGHMLIEIESKVDDDLCFSIKSADNTINMWQGIVIVSNGYYGSFSSNGYSWAVDGDDAMTVSDLTTTHSAIPVGAYNSKPKFKNIQNQNLYYPGYVWGDLALFSSHGPSADDKTIPFITGPGLGLVSSVSSYDSDFIPGGAGYSAVISKFVSPLNGRTYPFAIFAGTSMSSPSVAGIVALLLQIDPALTPEDVKTILKETAITDSHTGTLPAEGSNTWGFGKVDAYKALYSILPNVGIHNLPSTLEMIMYPNPGNGIYSIEYTSPQQDLLKLKVMDALGKIIYESNWSVKSGNNIFTLNLEHLPSGMYLTGLWGKEGNSYVRIVKR